MADEQQLPQAVDVVCVGGGGAGLAAAAAAAERGASALVLEKRRALGGNSRAASGIFAAESRVHERLNIVAPKDLLFRQAVEYSQWALDAALVRAFVDRSADTIDWLERIGVEFEWVTPLFEGQHPPTWHVASGGGGAVVDAIAAYAQQLGAHVVAGASVTAVERGADGGFTVACTLDDGAHEVSARAVVIATGGYGGNAEMLREHCPGYEPESWFCSGLRHEGDGIRMGWTLGADADGLGLCEFHAPSVQGPFFLSMALRDPRALIVNAHGRRFFDEGIVDNAFEAANAVRRQPGQVAFGLLDARLAEDALRKAANKAQGPLYADQMNSAEQFRKLLADLGGKRGGVAQTIAEAAAVVGCDAAALEATVAAYNDGCAAGHDAWFAKPRRYLRALEQPPFYVLRGSVGFFNTIGGLRVSERLELLDAERNPLPGLYGGGVDVGGWQGTTYNFNLAGGSFGFALNSGRIAGESAADYVRGADRPGAAVALGS